MYRNEWDAAVARASALEHQLRQAQSAQVVDAATIATLTQQLAAANGELARLRGGAYMPPPYGMPYGAPMGYLAPSRSSTIMVLGILSLVVCGLLGPVAWSMGNTDLAAIDRGEMDPSGRGQVQAGRICGMIASILMIVSVVLVLFVFMAMGTSSHR